MSLMQQTSIPNNMARLEALEERQRRIEEERDILRSSDASRRLRLLRYRQLPLPDNPEEVAVLGVAVLDLPDSRTGGAHEHDTRLSTLPYDPLQALAARYGGGQGGEADEESGEVDYATFLEVLCPNGSSLLERLPLRPASARESGSPLTIAANRHEEQENEAGANSASLLLQSPSPCHHTATQLPSPMERIHPLSTPRGTQGDNTSPLLRPNLSPATKSTTAGNGERRSPSASASAAAPSAPQPLPQQQEHSTILSPLLHPDQQEERRPSTNAPDIFVSGGSLTVEVPTRKSRGRWSKLAVHRSPSPPPQLSFCSDRQRSISGLSNPSNGSSPPSSPTTAAMATPSGPGSPFPAIDVYDLSGRILLTDRLVESQANTALPAMIAAFKQFMRAAAVNNSSMSAFSAEELRQRSRRQQVSEKQHYAAIQQTLAPRQRGIVLEFKYTDPEVAKCIAQAMRCRRPTFRQMDPASLYSSSTYITRSPAKSKGKAA